MNHSKADTDACAVRPGDVLRLLAEMVEQDRIAWTEVSARLAQNPPTTE